MDESCTDEIAIGGEAFEMVIEKSDDGWLFDVSDAVGVGEDAVGFIEEQVVWLFFDDGEVDLWGFFQDDGREVSGEVINENAVSIF
jgi:hypothetical protein